MTVIVTARMKLNSLERRIQSELSVIWSWLLRQRAAPPIPLLLLLNRLHAVTFNMSIHTATTLCSWNVSKLLPHTAFIAFKRACSRNVYFKLQRRRRAKYWHQFRLQPFSDLHHMLWFPHASLNTDIQTTRAGVTCSVSSPEICWSFLRRVTVIRL